MLIDVILLILMVMAVVKGLQRGLIVALFSMIAFIIGLVAALKLSTVVAGWLDESINISVRWLPFLSFILVFIAVVLIVRLLAKLLQSAIELAMLGWLNKIGGVLMYAILYVIIFSTILFFATQLHVFGPETLAGSTTYPFIEPVGPWVINGIGNWMPWFKDMFTELEVFFGKLSEKVRE
jgi:membrane protein required for colicin V production